MMENVLLCHQVMLENQNRRIDDLLERIRLQQEKLDKQNVRIRTLQSQVSRALYRALFDTDTCFSWHFMGF